MFGFYLFSLVLGGGLLLFSVLGDILGSGDTGDGQLDLGGDMDVGGDMDLGGDADLGGDDVGDLAGHDAAHVDHDAPFKIVSLRTATYFLFGFGGVGTLMTLLTDSPLLTAVLSFGTGLAAAALVAVVFRWLSVTEGGGREEGEDLFVGLPARVTVPLGAGRRGKVLVRRGQRTFELMARPFDADASGMEGWRQVVVVDMERGTALVSPMEDVTAELPSRSES